MSEESTPLRGNTRGQGWHLQTRRRVTVRILAPVAGLLIVAAGVLGPVAEDAGVAATVLVVLFGAAIGVMPFVVEPSRDVPPRTVSGGEERGLLVPAPTLGLAAVSVFAVLGASFLLAAISALVLLVRGEVVARSSAGRAMPLPVGVVVCSVLAALFLCVVVAIVRSRRRQRGLLLTPARIVLPDGTGLDWRAVTAIRPCWSRAGGGAFDASAQILNWIVFDMPPERVPHGSALVVRGKALSGLETPALSVAALASPAPAVLALLRYYLDHAAARAELGTPGAVARFEAVTPG